MQSRYSIGLAALLLALPASAADIGLVGVFPGKAAVLVIDGGAPTAVRIGRTKQGVSVVSAGEDQAVIEVEGKRRTLRLGQYASVTFWRVSREALLAYWPSRSVRRLPSTSITA